MRESGKIEKENSNFAIPILKEKSVSLEIKKSDFPKRYSLKNR
jgi:hypothetical protein